MWPQNQIRNPKYARKTVKGGGGSLILWSWIFKIVFCHIYLLTQFLWKDALHREIVEKKIYFLPTKFSPIFIRLWMCYFTVAHTLYILIIYVAFNFFLRAIVCWYVTWAIVTYNMKLKEWRSNQISFYQYSEELVQKRHFVFFLKEPKVVFHTYFQRKSFIITIFYVQLLIVFKTSENIQLIVRKLIKVLLKKGGLYFCIFYMC